MNTKTSPLQISRATVKTSVRAGTESTRAHVMSSSYLMSCMITCNVK